MITLRSLRSALWRMMPSKKALVKAVQEFLMNQSGEPFWISVKGLPLGFTNLVRFRSYQKGEPYFLVSTFVGKPSEPMKVYYHEVIYLKPMQGPTLRIRGR